MMDRRRFIASGLALSPIAAFLSGCGAKGDWPEGMAEIKWDRDTCTRCSMVISDRRFAAQLRGGDRNLALKFDDIGCAVVWIRDKAKEHPWLADAQTRFWVANAGSKEGGWLDARKAFYVGGARSPMGYNYAARAYADAGAQGFDDMRQHVLALGR